MAEQTPAMRQAGRRGDTCQKQKALSRRDHRASELPVCRIGCLRSQGAALPKTDLGEDGAEGSLTINEVPKREVRLDMPDTGALRSEPEQPGAQGLSAPPDQMESSATDGCLGSLSSGTPCPEDKLKSDVSGNAHLDT